MHAGFQRHYRSRILAAGVLCIAMAWPLAAQEAPPPESAAPESAESEKKQEAEAPVVRKREESPVKSLFFSDDEMKALQSAVDAFTKRLATMKDKGSKEEDFLKELEGIKKNDQEEKYFTYPQFYLESLAFHNPKSWSIRLNGNEITQLTPKGKDGLTVIDINRDKVTIEWKPRNMERVNEIWDMAANNQIKVDDIRGLVTFSLYLNQTFSSYTMRVVEGKVIPVTVVNNPDEIQMMPVKKQDKDKPKPRQPNPGQEKDTGLGGLIDTYKKLNQE